MNYQARPFGQVEFYSGPDKPDKGQRDGSCNRSACQKPLEPEIQHCWMDDPTVVGGRRYYCCQCSDKFQLVDLRNGHPFDWRIKRELKVA